MRLAAAPRGDGGAFIWWSVPTRAGLGPPIIGIEIDASPDGPDQWLLSDHGVRRYRYQGSRVTQAGPPVPTFPSADGLNKVWRWLRFYLPLRAPNHALPAVDLERLDSMDHFLETVERRWVSTRVDPPAGLTPNQIAKEMEAFPHGISQLLAVTEHIGG